MKLKQLSLIFMIIVIAVVCSAFTSAFTTVTLTSASMMGRQYYQKATKTTTSSGSFQQQTIYHSGTKHVVPISMSKYPSSDVDGTGIRGPIILTITLLFTVWLFSIPPEFRRAHVCAVERCVANRASCNDCQTIDEIKNGVIEYYKNGGGIQFDFSIDPVTIEKNKEFIKGIGL